MPAAPTADVPRRPIHRTTHGTRLSRTLAVGVTVLLLTSAAITQASATPPAPALGQGPTAGGTTVSLNLPVITDQFRAKRVAAGFVSSAAIGLDDRLYSWGGSTSGGSGPTLLPNQAPGTIFTEVASTVFSSTAIDSNGQAWSWGYNPNGLLGTGLPNDWSTEHDLAPVVMPAGVSFTQLAASQVQMLALAGDGTAYAWGDNSHGVLGNGTDADQNTPQPVVMPMGVSFTEVAAGYSNSYALDTTGTVWAWGAQQWLGQAGVAADAWTPVAVPGLPPITELVAGAFTVFAHGNDGVWYAWGQNDHGELGTAATGTVPTPTPLSTSQPFTTISPALGTWASTAALTASGKAYAWGLGTWGALGNGSTTDSAIPAPVNMPNGHTFTQLSMGGAHLLTIDDAGGVWGWGNNDYGQLGDHTTDQRNTPVPVGATVSASQLTRVSFGDVDANPASFVDHTLGTWSVTTPAHAAATVDVRVEWTLDGVPQPPITYPAGFRFYAPGDSGWSQAGHLYVLAQSLSGSHWINILDYDTASPGTPTNLLETYVPAPLTNAFIPDGLGVSPDGDFFYTFTEIQPPTPGSTSPREAFIVRWTVGDTTPTLLPAFSLVDPAAGHVTAGSVNPVDGAYYFAAIRGIPGGGLLEAHLYRYDPVDATRTGLVAKLQAPLDAGMLAQEPADATYTGDLLFDDSGTLSIVTSNDQFDASTSSYTADFALRATFAAAGFSSLPGITSTAQLSNVPTLTDANPTIAVRPGVRISGAGLVGSELRATGVTLDQIGLNNFWLGLDPTALGEIGAAPLAIPPFSVAWDAASVVLPKSTGGGTGNQGGSGGTGGSGGGTSGGGSQTAGSNGSEASLSRTGSPELSPELIAGGVTFIVLGAAALVWGLRRRPSSE